MNYLTHPLLNDKEIEILKHNLQEGNNFWEEGKKTAGNHAAKVKENLQFKRESEISNINAKLIREKMLNNALIKSFCLPKNIHGIMFTKSIKKMRYGRHIDNPFMSTGRADLSFTIFLNKKESYQGGELLIETMNSEKSFKLDIGKIIIYPSTYLHSVKEVEYGERLVCVGWIESYIKSSEERDNKAFC